jgi:predicted permease
MTRTFTILSILLGIVLIATFSLGWLVYASGRENIDVFLVHFYFGLGSAIGMLLVHCLVFTYFLGTGRWVKEVTLAYKLPDEPWHKATRELKRRVFPPALYAMLIGVATSAAGAGAQLQAWPWFVHATLAILTLVINLWAFRIELSCMLANSLVIDGVLAEVDRVRKAMGLNTNAEALAEEMHGGR